MMKEVTDIKTIQDIALDLLIKIDKICRTHHLRYSLNGGTLIGAIRHKGFIPWDDDIDIFMPRPDFDRLIELVKESNDECLGILDYYDTNSMYAGKVTKIYDTRTQLFEYPDKYNYQYGMFVDVFPVDGLPSNYEAAARYMLMSRIVTKLVRPLVVYQHRKKGLKKRLGALLNKLGTPLINKQIYYYQKFSYNNSEQVAIIVFGERIEKGLMLASDFDTLIDVEFEGHRFLAIKEYDRYLKKYYGDYMKLPPREEQIAKHEFVLFVND